MLSSCLTRVTDGEATRGLKMGIILLIKKKYRKQHASVGYETENERQKESGKGENTVDIVELGNNREYQ